MPAPHTQGPRARLQDHLKCLVCGAKFKNVAAHALPRHGLTSQEYRDEFDVRYLLARSLRHRISRARTVWTQGRIVSELRRLDRARVALNPTAFLKARDRAHRYLSQIARFQFGSYEKALEAAGIEYRDALRIERWSKKRVIQELRKHHARGLSLARGDVGYRLIAAARRWFGSYREGVRAAGLAESYVRSARAVRWDRRMICTEIQRRARSGKPLNYAGVLRSDRRLLDAARRDFGSWDHALKTAGINVDRARVKKRWSRQLILEELRRTASARHRMNRAEWKQKNRALVEAAYRQFGGLAAARAGEGISA